MIEVIVAGNVGKAQAKTIKRNGSDVELVEFTVAHNPPAEKDESGATVYPDATWFNFTAWDRRIIAQLTALMGMNSETDGLPLFRAGSQLSVVGELEVGSIYEATVRRRRRNRDGSVEETTVKKLTPNLDVRVHNLHVFLPQRGTVRNIRITPDTRIEDELEELAGSVAAPADIPF